MAVNVVGVVGIVIFYILILAIGIWAAFRKKKGSQNRHVNDDNGGETENVILAGRSLGLFVGVMTMTGQ